MPGMLAGKRAVVTGTGTTLGSGLEEALRLAGADVVGLVDTVYTSRDAAVAAFASAASDLGGPLHALVHAAMPEPAFERIAFSDVDDERWHAVWEGAMRTTLFVLQAAFAQMKDHGGRIVLVTPTVSMSGAEQLVPYTVAVEGQRLMAKSAARQWGAQGITVNCLAPAPEHVPIGVTSMSVSLAPPALGGPGDIVKDLGPLAAWLASDAAHFLTGATLSADGGVWMAP